MADSEILPTFVATNNKLVMVYFKYLFQHMEDLSPNEGIVYSELLLHSLTSNRNYLSGELLYIDAAKDEVGNFRLMEWTEEIDYFPMDNADIMKATELSFPTVKKIVESLQSKGYINGNYIKCPLEALKAGYVKIPNGTKLKGRHLVFYAFLLDRSYKHNGTVDTWAYRFEELCRIKEGHAYKMINHLKKEGLLERTEDGKLKILKPEKKKQKKKGKLSQLPQLTNK